MGVLELILRTPGADGADGTARFWRAPSPDHRFVDS
jgi:hypothetical protein